jgi:hypothetical protein
MKERTLGRLRYRWKNKETNVVLEHIQLAQDNVQQQALANIVTNLQVMRGSEFLDELCDLSASEKLGTIEIVYHGTVHFK